MRGTGQILQFPLARGLDQDSNAKNHPVSALRSGVNVRWPRDGCIGKRFGAKRLDTDGLEEPYRFVLRGSELSVIGEGRKITTYDPVIQSWRTNNLGRLPEPQLDWGVLADDQQGVAHADIFVSGDYLVHAWVTGDPTRIMSDLPQADASGDGTRGTGGTAFVQAINWRTGQSVITPTLIRTTAVRQVRLVGLGPYVYVVYSHDTNISVTPIDLVGFDVEGFQTIITDAENSSVNAGYYSVFDAISLASGSLCVVYEDDGDGEGGGTGLCAKRFTRSLSVLTLAADVHIAEPDVLSLAIVETPADNLVRILYCHANSFPDHRVRFCTVNNTSMAVVQAAVSVDALFKAGQLAIHLHNGEVFGVWAGIDQIGRTSPMMVSSSLTSAGAIDAARTYKSGGLALLSRLFEMDGRMYAYCSDSADNDSVVALLLRTKAPSISTYLVEFFSDSHDDPSLESLQGPPHRYVGKIDHDIASRFQFGIVPQVPVIDELTALGIVPYQAEAAQQNFNWRTGVRLVRSTVDPTLFGDWGRSVSIGQEAYISGAYLSAWDGRLAFDYGMRQPILIDLTSGSANTGFVANANYSYQFMAGFRSWAGVLHRSPMTPPVTITHAGANASVRLWVAPNSIDGKQNLTTGFGEGAAGVSFFDTYRTAANGSTLHKLTYEPRYNVRVNRVLGGVAMEIVDRRNDSDITESFGVTETGAVANTAITSRPQPYTASLELEDCQPPAPWTVLVHGRRIFVVTGLRREIWFSKDFTENGPGVAPGFSPLQVELYEQDITGLASMDSYRIVFHETGLWSVEGDGPTVAGTDNRFSTPRPVQSDVGCTNPQSIVSTPMGVLFQSETDIYILQRNLTVEWAGRAARDVVAAYPVITSAVLVADQNEVRFTCNDETETSGVVLVYDYVRQTWTTRTYADGAAIQDSCVFDGLWHFIADAAVWRESLTTHLDDVGGTDSFVPSEVEFEDITPAGQIGWQRVRMAKLLGQSLSNHQLTIAAARDFADTYEQTETFAAGSAVTTPSAHARMELLLTVQRRQAVRLKITDAAPANVVTHPLGDGAGFLLEGVALLVQPKPGLPRDISTRRGG